MDAEATAQTPQLADRWRRLVARVVDVIVLAALTIGSLFAAHKLDIERFPINDAIVFGVLCFYEVLVPAFANGSSLGRRLVRIRLASESECKAPSLLRCFGRFVARAGLFALFTIFVAYEIALPSFLIVLVLEGIVGALHPRRQTLGDLVGRTVVVRSAPRVATAV